MAPLEIPQFTHKVKRVAGSITDGVAGVTEHKGSTLHSTDASSVSHRDGVHLSTQTRNLLTAHPVLSLKPPPLIDSSLPRPTKTPHVVPPTTLTTSTPQDRPPRPTKVPRPDHDHSNTPKGSKLQHDPPESTREPRPHQSSTQTRSPFSGHLVVPHNPSSFNDSLLPTPTTTTPHVVPPATLTESSGSQDNPPTSTITPSPFDSPTHSESGSISTSPGDPTLPTGIDGGGYGDGYPPLNGPSPSPPHPSPHLSIFSASRINPRPHPSPHPSTKLFSTSRVNPPPHPSPHRSVGLFSASHINPPPSTSTNPPRDPPSFKLSHPTDLPEPEPEPTKSPTNSPHNVPSAPQTAKLAPKPPTPARTQTTTVPQHTHAPDAPTAQPSHILTSTATNPAVGDRESDPTSTSTVAPPVPLQSGNVGNTGIEETTIEASTTIVTTGVFTTSLPTVLPNGQTSGVVTTTTGIHTITTTTAVPTQIGTVNSESGPSTSAIGGASGAIATVILALLVCWLLRRRRRHLNNYSQIGSGTGLPTSTIGATSATSTVSRPFLGTSPVQGQPTEKRERGPREYPDPLPRYNRADDQDNVDPFRDPETAQGQEEIVAGARSALGHLQELTRGAEEELRELEILARRRPLTEIERERLDEIRRTTGLVKGFDLGRLSTTSSSTYFTPPPSYHSD